MSPFTTGKIFFPLQNFIAYDFVFSPHFSLDGWRFFHTPPFPLSLLSIKMVTPSLKAAIA